MKCPACDHPLTETRVGSVAIDVCANGCGGIWFDTHELKKVEEEHGDTSIQDVSIRRAVAVKVDAVRPRHCPRCRTEKLETRIPRLGSAIEFDCCPRCAGYWLDYGELETLLKENRQLAPAKTGKRIHVSLEVVRFIHTVKIRKLPSLPERNRTPS